MIVRRRARGFTLLELLVVLALIALVAAIAAPRMVRLLDSAERANERSEVLAQVAGLGYRVQNRARELTLTASDTGPAAALLDLPPG